MGSEVPKNWCLPNTGALTVLLVNHQVTDLLSLAWLSIDAQSSIMDMNRIKDSTIMDLDHMKGQ